MLSLFSGIDPVRRIMMDNPRIAGLSGFFIFLLFAGGVAVWDTTQRDDRQSVSVDIPLCVLRSHASVLYPENRGHLNHIVNDSCSKAAKEWTQQMTLGKEMMAQKKMAAAQGLDNTLKNQIISMTIGYPIEIMSTSLAQYDREVAALLVGIAKKESNWGRRVPRSADGADCFNYWGFKGAGSRGVAMGHGCFGSPEEAVEMVGNRVAELVHIRSTSEPKNFTIWKCGSSCATHTPESVRKWVSDVDQYYRVLVASR